MSSSPSPAASDCLMRKWPSPGLRDRAALAEYTITRPKNISRTTVVKSTLSKASFFAMRPSFDHCARQFLEDVAAVVEILELVEARAGRREDDRLAPPRLARRRAHGAIERLRSLEGDGALQGGREFLGGLADEVGAAGLAGDHWGERREIGVLVAPAEDQMDGAVGEPLDRLHRGARV